MPRDKLRAVFMVMSGGKGLEASLYVEWLFHSCYDVEGLWQSVVLQRLGVWHGYISARNAVHRGIQVIESCTWKIRRWEYFHYRFLYIVWLTLLIPYTPDLVHIQLYEHQVLQLLLTDCALETQFCVRRFELVQKEIWTEDQSRRITRVLHLQGSSAQRSYTRAMAAKIYKW